MIFPCTVSRVVQAAFSGEIYEIYHKIFKHPEHEIQGTQNIFYIDIRTYNIYILYTYLEIPGFSVVGDCWRSANFCHVVFTPQDWSSLAVDFAHEEALLLTCCPLKPFGFFQLLMVYHRKTWKTYIIYNF